MGEDSIRFAREWLIIGEKDLRRVEILLNADDPEGAAFFLQQSAEKLLKGYLIAQGWKLKKTHDLVALVTEADKYSPGMKTHLPVCRRLSEIYVADRYPGSSEGYVSVEEVRRYVREAQPLIEIVRLALKKQS